MITRLSVIFDGICKSVIAADSSPEVREQLGELWDDLQEAGAPSLGKADG